MRLAAWREQPVRIPSQDGDPDARRTLSPIDPGQP